MAKLLWTQKQNFGPNARWAHAMVYDAARQRIVLFGGHFAGADEYTGDTWEWDGQTWVQMADIGPTGRYRHHLVYDTTRERIILYGGRVLKGGRATNETWEWSGIEWIQIADTGPVFEHGTTAMVYDRGRERIVLFGSPEGTRSETWEWDGDEWTQQEDIGPSARFHTAMAYDNARNCTVLFAGALNDGTGLGDTWEWDGTTWKQRADFGPLPRHEHAMVFDEDRKRAVLFGGLTQKIVEGASIALFLADTWEWGTATVGFSDKTWGRRVAIMLRWLMTLAASAPSCLVAP